MPRPKTRPGGPHRSAAHPSTPEGVAPSPDCQRSPLRQHHGGRVLPQTEACFGPLVPPSGHVPSSRSLTALTAFATRRLQACCSLQPTLRFAGFQTSRPRARGRRVPPHRRLALQSLPLPDSAWCVTAPACPLVVRHPAGSARPRGLSPSTSPLRSPPVKEGVARCSHGLPVLEHRAAPEGTARVASSHRPCSDRACRALLPRAAAPSVGFSALPMKGPHRGR